MEARENELRTSPSASRNAGADLVANGASQRFLDLLRLRFESDDAPEGKREESGRTHLEEPSLLLMPVQEVHVGERERLLLVSERCQFLW